MRRMVWQTGEGVAYEQQVANGQKQGVRELPTIEELEERIKKLEERISIQDKTIK